MHWDKELAGKLRQWGLTQEQVGRIIGEVAEQRQVADAVGYERGYVNGYAGKNPMNPIRQNVRNFYMVATVAELEEAIRQHRKQPRYCPHKMATLFELLGEAVLEEKEKKEKREENATKTL